MAKSKRKTKWVYQCSEFWNDTTDLVTYHVHINDKDKNVLEKKYLFPKGKKYMKNHQDYEYSSIKIAGNMKKKWVDGYVKRRRSF